MRSRMLRGGLFAGFTLLPFAVVAQPATVAEPVVSSAERAELPLWELGVAAIGVSVPDYPGADRNRLRVLPLPYAIYRGKTLRADDEGLRSRYLFSPTAELDVSFGGALPADSSGNAAREGMPDLDLLLEVGPQLTLRLAEPEPGASWRLVLPVRGVFSTDFSNFKSRGLLFAPELTYARSKVAGSAWTTSLTASSGLATESLHRYFYEVAPEFAQPARPAYEARGGYLESSLTAAVSRGFRDRLNVFVFGRVTSLHGAANADSPLLRDDLNFALGAGFTYRLRRSTETVSADD